MNELTAFLKTRKKANLTIVAINVLVFIVFSIIGNTEDAQFMLTHGMLRALGKRRRGIPAVYSDVSALWSGASGRKYAASDFSRRYTGAGSRFRSLSDYLSVRRPGRKCALLLYRALPEELCSVGRRFRSTVCLVIGALVYLVLRKRGDVEGISWKKAAFDGSSFDRPGIYRGWN